MVSKDPILATIEIILSEGVVTEEILMMIVMEMMASLMVIK